MATKNKVIALSLEEVEAMTQTERVKVFGEKGKSATSLFLQMGILTFLIDRDNAGDVPTRQLLLATGADEKLVCNGEYASHAVALVAAGLITELQYYNKVTFSVARAIKAGMGKGRNKPTHVLTAEVVAETIKKSKNPALDLACLQEHDMTADKYSEWKAACAKQEAERIAAEKAKAEELAAAEKAKAEKAAKELAAANKKLAKIAESAPVTDEKAEDKPKADEPKAESKAPDEPEAEVEAEDEPEAEDTGEFSTVDDVMASINELESEIAALPEGTDFRPLYKRLVDLCNIVGDQITEPLQAVA